MRNTAMDRNELAEICKKIHSGQQILSHLDPNNPRMDRASLLLNVLCEALYRRFELVPFCGLSDSGGPTLAIDFERRILDVLAHPFAPRIEGFADLDDIIETIRTHLQYGL